MFSPKILALAFTVAPSLVSAALFPPDSLVKMIDAKGFKKAMKQNETSVVAFVAPWCGHCQKMAPEYSKAALGLYPLVPSYAVDCDADKNKKLCAEQGIQGFPTVKLFPRGNKMAPIIYEDERTASGLYYFVSRGMPQFSTKVRYDYDLQPWVEKHQSKPRALLLRKEKKTPLLWQALANKYYEQIEFGVHLDRKGKTAVSLGLEAGEKKVSKVLLYPAGSTNFVRFHGVQKFDSLSKFLDSVLNGTADLSSIVEETKAEEFVMDEAELEIERKQEAQRIALLHGGFTSLIDFEKAIKEGGAGYHDSHGYMGVMGGIPEHLKKKPAADSASSETTPEKEDKAAQEPVTPPESAKAPEPVVEDKEQDAEVTPTEEGDIPEQVILEVAKDRDAKASPGGCQNKDSAEQSSCTTAPVQRPKDEL